nr:tyrosine-type recombinase/integrase [Prescottella equi]
GRSGGRSGARAPSSAARALIAVRGLHRFAAAEGVTSGDVARAVKPPTPGRRLPKRSRSTDVLAILEASGGDGSADNPRTLRDRALLECSTLTGARHLRSRRLDVEDLDTKSRSVLLRGKGGKERGVPVGTARDHRDRQLSGSRAAGVVGAGWSGAVPQRPWRAALPAERAWQVLHTADERRPRIAVAVSPHTLRPRSRHTCSTAALTCVSCRKLLGAVDDTPEVDVHDMFEVRIVGVDYVAAEEDPGVFTMTSTPPNVRRCRWRRPLRCSVDDVECCGRDVGADSAAGLGRDVECGGVDVGECQGCP